MIFLVHICTAVSGVAALRKREVSGLSPRSSLGALESRGPLLECHTWIMFYMQVFFSLLLGREKSLYLRPACVATHVGTSLPVSLCADV